jgi:hypothetical protein
MVAQDYLVQFRVLRLLMLAAAVEVGQAQVQAVQGAAVTVRVLRLDLLAQLILVVAAAVLMVQVHM